MNFFSVQLRKKLIFLPRRTLKLIHLVILEINRPNIIRHPFIKYFWEICSKSIHKEVKIYQNWGHRTKLSWFGFKANMIPDWIVEMKSIQKNVNLSQRIIVHINLVYTQKKSDLLKTIFFFFFHKTITKKVYTKEKKMMPKNRK